METIGKTKNRVLGPITAVGRKFGLLVLPSYNGPPFPHRILSNQTNRLLLWNIKVV